MIAAGSFLLPFFFSPLAVVVVGCALLGVDPKLSFPLHDMWEPIDEV